MPMAAPRIKPLKSNPDVAAPSRRFRSEFAVVRPERDGYHRPGSEDRSIAVPGLGGRIRIKIASEREELEQAFRLLSDRYKDRGYDAPHSSGYRYTPYHALPGTVTFVAKEGDRVVATMSLVADNPVLGLPMEGIYGEEVEELRREGRRLAEVTSLAEEGLGHRDFLRTFAAMIRLMFQHHVRQGGDSWVITVNPRHRNYYRKVLGFVPVGPCRSYSAVGDHPAEAFLVDADMMRENAPTKHAEIFGEPLPRTVLTAVSRPSDHAVHFGKRSSQADYRTILEVLVAGFRAGRSPHWAVRVDDPTRSVGGAEGGGPCGSWRSRRCSPIAAGC